jgi:hypothetical protein
MNWPDFELPPINLWSVWRQVEPVKQCVYKCRLDQKRQICTGCGRTVEEIQTAGANRKRLTERPA